MGFKYLVQNAPDEWHELQSQQMQMYTRSGGRANINIITLKINVYI